MYFIKVVLVAIVVFSLASCASFTSEKPTRSYYFKDTVDNGNDALTAGCHVEYLTNACDKRQVIGVSGDRCLSKASIDEYTNNQTCHEHNTNTTPADISSLNCSEVCGSRGGRCETVSNACAIGSVTSDSARCVCNEK